MKTSLIIMSLFVASAFAAEKNPDMRQGTKAVDEKYLETPSRKNLSSENQAFQDKSKQLESKGSRQYQEERPSQIDKIIDQE